MSAKNCFLDDFYPFFSKVSHGPLYILFLSMSKLHMAKRDAPWSTNRNRSAVSPAPVIKKLSSSPLPYETLLYFSGDFLFVKMSFLFSRSYIWPPIFVSIRGVQLRTKLRLMSQNKLQKLFPLDQTDNCVYSLCILLQWPLPPHQLV